MIKLVIGSALVAATAALFTYPIKVPQIVRIPTLTPTYSPQPGRSFAIIRSSSDIAPDGSSYDYAYDTENGISAQQSGRLVGSGPKAGVAATGSFSFTSPEGVPVQIRYLADENGYQPSGNVLPTPPPIPQAILRSIEYNKAHPEPQSSARQTFYKR